MSGNGMTSLAAGELQHTAHAAAPDVITNDCRVDAHRSVDRLAGAWEDLEQRARGVTVFQSRAWCSAWLEATAQVGLAQEARILTLWSGDRIVLLWPLAVRRAGPCRVLHALGEPATQYCDALIAADADRDQLLAMAWSAVRSWCDIDLVELRRVRADAAIVALPALVHAASVNATAAPFVDLQIAGAAAHRSSRTRNALRRHRKKLAEHGDVAFELVEAAEAKIRVVDEAVAFKRRWMAERGLWSDGYAHAAADAFTRPLAQRPGFCVARLTVGDATVAVEAGHVIGATYWSLTQSYDPRFASHAPGRLLTWQFIEYCVGAGIRTLDFLAPAHDYKREWSTGEVAVSDYLAPLTLKGSLLAAALGPARPALKRVYAHLPAPLRRYATQFASGRH
jgi:CelD/BcsL family acetyltransferase involved in cellulose biosynthesis